MMKTALFKAFVVHHISSVLPMKYFHHFTGAANEYIYISVGRIKTNLTNLSTKTVHTHAHIGRTQRHYISIILVEIKHGVFDCKVRNQKRYVKDGLVRMLTLILANPR